VAFRPTLADGLALSIESILAGWQDMSKEKPDRAILTELDSFPSACLYRLAIEIFTFWHLAWIF
jgi:hypothetical protein